MIPDLRLREQPPRSPQRAVEPVFRRIIHLISLVSRSQRPLVESGVVSHQRQPVDQRRDLRIPDLRKERRIVRVLRANAVYLLGEEAIIVVRRGPDQPVQPFDDLAAAHDDQSDRADARRAAVGGLEVYGGEIFHPVIVPVSLPAHFSPDKDSEESRLPVQKSSGSRGVPLRPKKFYLCEYR